MSSPLLSDISYGESSVKDTVRLVIVTTSPFDILIPSDDIIAFAEPLLLGTEIFPTISPGCMTIAGDPKNV